MRDDKFLAPKFRQPPAYTVNVRAMLVDLESTGLNMDKNGLPDGSASILQIGAVDLLTGRSFYARCRMRDGASVSDEALKVNGISKGEATDPALMSEADALKGFGSWAMDVKKSSDDQPRMLAGINPRFDLGLLHSSATHAGMDLNKEFPFCRRTIGIEDLCVHEAYRRGLPIPGKGFDTDKVYRLLGLPCEPRPHNAFLGALYGARALDELMPHAHMERRIDPPENCGDLPPAYEDPFTVPSTRKVIDMITDRMGKGKPLSAEGVGGLLQSKIEGGRVVCENPAFEAHFQAIVRAVNDPAITPPVPEIMMNDMARQYALTRDMWADMDMAVAKARQAERSLNSTEDNRSLIAGIKPPKLAPKEETLAMAAPSRSYD